MSQLMQDKIIQSAIEGLEHLPADVHFNSQKTWAELSTQLPSQKKPLMYWYYAAALIALTLTTFFLSGDESERKQSSLNSSQAYKKPDAQELKIIVPAKKQQEQVILHSLKREKTFPVHTDTIAKEIVVTAVEIPTSTAVPDINTNNIQTVNEINQPAIITAQKAISKKYKIVHLNELSPLRISTEEAKMLSKNELKKNIPKTDLFEMQDAVEIPAKQFLFFKKAPLINHPITISDN